MKINDLISIISIIIAMCALIYSIISNTKKYELTYQYYNDILEWHNDVVEILVYLRLSNYSNKNRTSYMSKLSALIEQGRFYFPNLNKNDAFGKEKTCAYQGYRNATLDFLVFSFQLFMRPDYKNYIKHAELLQKLFTSQIFNYLEPQKRRKQIKKNTTINKDKDFTLDDFLKTSPEYIYSFYYMNSNVDDFFKCPTKR